jgi:hypothetical protein
MTSRTTARARQPIALDAHGRPRTYRLAPASRHAAYRRLAIAILGLDVPALAHELRVARRALAA